MVVLTLKAKHDHLQKVASTRDYVKALAEFVWNALDADATQVSVDLIRNALGGLESFLIRDNGTGISKKRAEHDFESLGESGSSTRAARQCFLMPCMGRKVRGACGFSRSLDERAGTRSTEMARRGAD